MPRPFFYAGVTTVRSDVDNAGRISFTPAAGFEVSFDSFDFVDRNSGGRSATFSLGDSLGNTLFDFTSLVALERTTYTAATGFFSTVLRAAPRSR